MKKLSTLLFFLLIQLPIASADTFEQLKKINAYWAEQNINPASLPEFPEQDDRAWIRTHLQLVENLLRARKVDELSATQKINRLQSLDHLHDYLLAGAFPVNDAYAYATPIFIDAYDNFCAVGYLLKASGQEALARKISRETNLAYVKDMDYPELLDWAKDHGFSVEELAWIQPEYGPPIYFEEVAGGVSGEVRSLLPVMSDYNPQMSDRLYVGGNFIAAGGDSSIIGIGYLSPTDIEGIYEWNKMGDGLSGTVLHIIEWNGNIVAAGDLGNATEDEGQIVMQWNGSAWESIGCLNGWVKSLAVVEGELYASGMFTVCGEDTASANFAHWHNGSWEVIPGLEGQVNVLRLYGDTTLIVGGLFSYDGSPLNLIKWSPGVGFIPYGNGSTYEVNDVYNYYGELHAACSRINLTDSIEPMILKLDDDLWLNFLMQGFDADKIAKDYYVLKQAHNGFLFAAGEPNSLGYITGVVYLQMQAAYAWGPTFDGPAYAVAVFQDRTFLGGAFTQNSVCRGLGMYYTGTSTTEMDRAYTVEIYPNPVQEGQLFIRHNQADLQMATLTDLEGRVMTKWALSSTDTVHQLKLPKLSAGIYLLKLIKGHGQVLTKKIAIQ